MWRMELKPGLWGGVCKCEVLTTRISTAPHILKSKRNASLKVLEQKTAVMVLNGIFIERTVILRAEGGCYPVITEVYRNTERQREMPFEVKVASMDERKHEDIWEPGNLWL